MYLWVDRKELKAHIDLLQEEYHLARKIRDSLYRECIHKTQHQLFDEEVDNIRNRIVLLEKILQKVTIFDDWAEDELNKAYSLLKISSEAME